LFQGGVRFDDGSLKISWPLEVTDISENDMSWESLGLNFEGVSL
jgi:dTDP-4-dehydrorhamnose 3,5-epimerase-like enzyme